MTDNDFILRRFVMLSGIDPDRCQTIRVKPMPDSVRERVHMHLEPRQCHANTFHSIGALIGHGTLHFVMGYAFRYIPVIHSWLRVNDEYYDPTWELLTDGIGTHYLSVVELTFEQMRDYALDIGFAPDLESWSKLNSDGLPIITRDECRDRVRLLDRSYLSEAEPEAVV